MSYKNNDCTDTALGTGRKNTELLVKAMGSSAYASSSGSDTTEEYAARLCWDLEFNGYDDWFLPSKDELILIYSNLYEKGLGGFSGGGYWSSSEDHLNSGKVYSMFFDERRKMDTDYRSFNSGVLAVRAF